MPTPELKRVKAIFAEALELTGGERETFLDDACGEDRALRAEVRAYLDASEQAGDALDSPQPASPLTSISPADTAASAPQQAVGSVIGNYQLVELIGQGGFGAVYRAAQQRPVRRDVALKIIKLGMDTQQVIARFEAERQALAMMDHPNISRVFEAGATESGRPYFVMELVRGVPITEYCDAHALTTAQRLALFMTVCDAIQHAHHKGVIHRDIKPSNVLVTLTGAGGSAVAKVIDFGISKATDHLLTDPAHRTTLTAAQHPLGTPAYMSPEQTGIGGQDIDTRSDIYSLGVLLYELLTGTTPFEPGQLADYGQTQRIIAEVDPPRPSSRLGAMGEDLAKVAASRGQIPQELRQSVRGELDWIVMKALEKDRARRYQSANELARDIRRHLNDEPIEAGPSSVAYRIRKFVRRHRTGVLTSGAFAILILAAVATYVHGVGVERRKTEAALRESQRQRRDADHRREEAQQASVRALAAEAQANQELVLAALTQGHGAQVSTRQGRRFDSLKLLAAAARISPTAAIRSQAIACMGLADMRITQQWSGPDHAVCFNHACTFYVDSTRNGEGLIRPVPRPDNSLPTATPAPTAPAIRLPGKIWTNPGLRDDGGRVVFSPDDQLVAVSHADGHVRVFRLDGRVVRDISQATACDFSPDGAVIAVCQRLGVVRIVDLKSGEERKRLLWPGSDSLSFSPDGRKLALWNPGSSDVLVGDIQSTDSKLVNLAGPINRLCWHPNGNILAAASEDRRVFVWDVADLKRPRYINGWGAHFAGLTSVEFNHGGNLLATASQDGTVRLWDLSTAEYLVRVFCTGILRFSPDDRTLTVAAYDGRHTVIEVATSGERRSLIVSAGNRACVAFNPDGAVLACDCENRVRFWNLTGSVANPNVWELKFSQQMRSVAFHPDGGSVFISTDAGLWRVPIETQLRAASAPRSPAAPTRHLTIGPVGEPLLSRIGNPGGPVQISRDGRLVAWAQYGRDAVIMDPEHPSEQRILPKSDDCRSISISPDGKWVATGSWKGAGDGRVRIWDSRTAVVVASLPISLDANVAFSPDNRWLVTTTPNESRFWEVGTWRPKHALAMESDVAGNIFFSPDSSIVALTSQHIGVRLVDVSTAVELATLEDEGDQTPLGFSPDGGLLVTRGRYATVRIWDLRLVRSELKEMGLDWSAPAFPLQKPAPAVDISLKTTPATLPAP